MELLKKTPSLKVLFRPISRRLRQLELFQSLYLLALVIMGLVAVEGELAEENLIVIGVLSLSALAIELWPKIAAAWETLLGRIVIILSYAVIGNFAVAFAGQKLNEIIGIDPSPLFYSISFVTILMAPLWILVMTLLAMIFYMIFVQIALLFKVAMRMLRISHGKKHNGIAYPITTAISRLILAPAMFVTLLAAINNYSGDLSSISISAKETKLDQKPDQLAPQDFIDEIQAGLEQASDRDNESGPILDVTNDVEKTSQATSSRKKLNNSPEANLNTIIAAFVYNVELFKHSQCVKAAKEHVMYIGENDILVGRPNPDSKTGYDFIVRPCTLKSF